MTQNKDGDHPGWFAPYLELEKRATGIWDYGTMFFMGLLQTEECARATLRAGATRDSQEVLRDRAKARMRRQEVMSGATPPRPSGL
ncbi:Scr1 family TA system antitoxin-like transcriptional regulator [Streptomyces sp. bgisy060]|uniref:Scr1 family TA system antitoxin-like transcriptional regulator n=1 Tax=Streptomyces sp. bgisy060 TaxID=3413775 RepID=UPI003EBC5CA5